MADDERVMSRRTGLKNLGVIGAAAAFGGAARTQTPAAAPAPRGDIVAVAVERMGKGHS